MRAELIVDGLRRLEYRGYDSAGLAVLDGGRVELRRCVGKIASLETLLREQPSRAPIGLGHTRWATHGRPSEANAHPHADCTGSLVVVHNGILENYVALKERLRAEGHQFRSETDTEVIAHLLESYLAGGLSFSPRFGPRSASCAVPTRCGISARSAPGSSSWPSRARAAVVVGLGEGEVHLASDIPALLPHTRDVVSSKTARWRSSRLPASS